jgi:hypothetical protein
MKRSVWRCLIILLIAPLSLAGQSTRNKSIGTNATISYNYLEDLKVHFLFLYTIKQHEPFVGLEFPVTREHISNLGFNAGYRFFPNKNRQTFDLFFIYMMQGGSRKMYSNSTVTGFSLHNLLGYGFNIRFNDNIYLTHHIAAGIENSWFGDKGSFSDFSLVINLGIGIKIKNLKPD